VYHKAERDDANEFDFGTTEAEEFHAYLIISLESKTMVCTFTKENMRLDLSTLYDVDGGSLFVTLALSFGSFRRRTTNQVKFVLFFMSQFMNMF